MTEKTGGILEGGISNGAPLPESQPYLEALDDYYQEGATEKQEEFIVRAKSMATRDPERFSSLTTGLNKNGEALSSIANMYDESEIASAWGAFAEAGSEEVEEALNTLLEALKF